MSENQTFELKLPVSDHRAHNPAQLQFQLATRSYGDNEELWWTGNFNDCNPKILLKNDTIQVQIENGYAAWRPVE